MAMFLDDVLIPADLPLTLDASYQPAQIAVVVAEAHREYDALVAENAELLDALRAFCGDHEATGFACSGLNTAYLHAMSVIRKVDGR